ncbi:MAG: outer membrane lipoprotein chaperone LolA [Granulosicoccus sp.]
MSVPNSYHNSGNALCHRYSSAARQVTGPAFICGAVLCLMVLLAPRITLADDSDVAPVQMLEQFIKSLDSFEASFEQTLYTSDSDDLGTSEGTIKLKRPARFVWTYTSPEPQMIVADGERIWLYDEDLEQVTVNAIDERINGTPLQLLMTEAPLSDAFDIESLGQSDGIDWFALTPVTQSSDFEQVFIGLKDEAIAAIELNDSFGQATQIRLSDFKQGVQFDDSLFVFEVPDGVDVIGLDE